MQKFSVVYYCSNIVIYTVVIEQNDKLIFAVDKIMSKTIGNVPTCKCSSAVKHKLPNILAMIVLVTL